MGNVSSRSDERGSIQLRDQSKLSIASLQIIGSRNRVLLNIVPNALPAATYNVRKEEGDTSLIEYVQDPETAANGGPSSLLLRLSNEEDLNFKFKFVISQSYLSQDTGAPAELPSTTPSDTVVNGLTFISASNPKELDNIITKQFHADPNIHKSPNVELLGDFATGGSPSIQFEWSWKWTPPKLVEDRGGGWRNSCSLVEYDQRAHRLNTLGTLSFWVANSHRLIGSPHTPSPRLELHVPSKLRVPSAQSIQSRISDSDFDYPEYIVPPSPNIGAVPEYGLGLVSDSISSIPQVDVACQRPGQDMSAVEDGPVFRANIKALEQKTGNMKVRMKKVLRKAEHARDKQSECNAAFTAFMGALREASSTNANAVQPAIDHYFDKIAKEILEYEKQNVSNLQSLIIEPLEKLYDNDIKQAESQKKTFDDESKEYYSYMQRYLGQRQDVKEKKRAETDFKYQSKRRMFELRKFDYSSFMQDLHGGRKDQEVLSHLTKYADAQAKSYLTTAKKVEEMIPRLEALGNEVREAGIEYQLQRTEREEKRRTIERTSKGAAAADLNPGPANGFSSSTNGNRAIAAGEGTTLRSLDTMPGASAGSPPNGGPAFNGVFSTSPTPNQVLVGSGFSMASATSPNHSKFAGIRDLEDRALGPSLESENKAGDYRREGILMAMKKAGRHADPIGLNDQRYHKFWVVLDQGKLTEYSDWKEKMDMHMEPIDLRVASVRHLPKDGNRSFMFEVITPRFTRQYQATSDDEAKAWVAAINNGTQGAFEAQPHPSNTRSVSQGSTTSTPQKDIAAALTGKFASPHSHSSHRSLSSAAHSSIAGKVVTRHATVGDRPRGTDSGETQNSHFAERVRAADPANCFCADCGSDVKVDWVSINFGMTLCIECGGIHRSLGTHISKLRSMTLDFKSFTDDVVELILKLGNSVGNASFETKLDKAEKLKPSATREQRLKFITTKYVDRAYVLQLGSSFSQYKTPEDMLLTSIKRNDFRNALYAVALRANPNATDRSRSTHAVFLALAAADPALPSTLSPTASTSSSAATTPTKVGSSAANGSAPRTAFPMAELLLLNGADIPNLPAPIPLTRNAQTYLEFKMSQRGDKPRHHQSTKEESSGYSGSSVGDRLGPLPTIVAGSPGDRERIRDGKLVKRRSGGGVG